MDELQATNAQLVADMKRIVSSLSELVQTMPVPSASSSGDDDRPAAAPAAEPTPDSVACQVRHPGALCCTKTTTRQSPDGQSVTITLETVAKLSSDSSAQRALGAEALATLAAQAVLGTASSLCRAKTAEAQGHVHPHEAVQQHAALRAILADGDILSAQRNAVSEFGHESFLLVVRRRVWQSCPFPSCPGRSPAACECCQTSGLRAPLLLPPTLPRPPPCSCATPSRASGCAPCSSRGPPGMEGAGTGPPSSGWRTS